MRVAFAAAVLTAAGAAWGYEPPAGFQKTGQTFSGSAIAVAPDGKVAVGTDAPAGGASIRIYGSLADVGNGAPLQIFADPAWKFIAGIRFDSPDSILFGENGAAQTVLRGTLASGAVAELAPAGSVPNINNLALSGSSVLAVSANGPAANDLISIPLSGGAPLTVIDNYGEGYGGGIAITPGGQILLTDTNDPTFSGHAGQILRYTSGFHLLGAVDLTGGGGSGAADIAVDSHFNVVVSTGPTLTWIPAGGAVAPFGHFDAFSFPTFLTFDDTAPMSTLLVSGFTDETGYAPGVFVVQAVPEPGIAGVALLGMVLMLRRRR